MVHFVHQSLSVSVSLVMLPEIVAEVLRFFDRDNLGRLRLVGSWLTEIIGNTCPRYPLRRVIIVDFCMDAESTDISVNVGIMIGETYTRTTRSFPSLAAALSYFGDIIRQSYVEWLVLGLVETQPKKVTITSDDWSTLMEHIGRGPVHQIQLSGAKIADVTADAFAELTTRPGLKRLIIVFSEIPSGHINDELLRSCLEKEIQLFIRDNAIVDARYFRINEDALPDFSFPIGGKQLGLEPAALH